LNLPEILTLKRESGQTANLRAEKYGIKRANG
jgi:hypothetical protein